MATEAVAAETQVQGEELPARATATPVAAPAVSATLPDGGAPAAPAKAAKPKKESKKDGKKASKKDAKAAEVDADGPSVAAHPRAARQVARAKGWGGLGGFLIGGYLSLPTSTLAGAGLRALVAGVVCYVAAWAGAVFLWRRLVMLELKGREQQLLAVGAKRQSPHPPPPAIERSRAGAAS
jgi:hypothetical protein